jgi:hypothetical protein
MAHSHCLIADITPHQRKVIKAAVHVRNNVKQFISKVAEARITEFLSAAARSDAGTIKHVRTFLHYVEQISMMQYGLEIRT